MRRVVISQMLMCTVAVLFTAGCSSSPRQEVAERSNTTEAEDERPLSAASSEATPGTGEEVGGPAGLADAAAATAEEESKTVPIADAADSDAPGAYQASAADAAAVSSPEAPQQAAVADEETLASGRPVDGDDPKAALVVPKIAEQQDEAPLDNGRGSSAKPLPEGQRVATAASGVAPESVDDGRVPDAEPGAEVPSQETAKPVIKPAVAKRQTLSDLPASIQALDQDADGQLGVYEWPREKLAEFKTLDANEDGFLTAAEIAAGQKKKTDAESKNTDEKTDQKTDERSQEQAEEKAAEKPEDSPQPEKEETPAADTQDQTEKPADEADSTEASSDDEKTEQED